MTPGSPSPGESLPANNSLAAVAYYKAIQQCGRRIWLDLSWKLDRDNINDWKIWQSNADSLRIDQDINNSNKSTLMSFDKVQRAIENYRVFINQQVEAKSRQGKPIMIRPDMDNLYTGNSESLTGLADQERRLIAIHWACTGGNLVTGSDLSNIDTLGKTLLYDKELLSIAAFTSQYPMQPKNPFGSTQPGSQASEQLQAWIAGPDRDKKSAVVVLANYGPDQGEGGFGSNLQGVQFLNVSLGILGIAAGQPSGHNSWNIRRILGGGGQSGPDYTDLGTTSNFVASSLSPGESALYYLTQ